MARDVSPWPITSYGWAPADMRYRFDWITPLTISPHDHNRVYVGAQVVFMTTDAGQSWRAISPDLTTNTKAHQQNSGGISADNLTTYDGGTLYAIAESPVTAGIIWTGSDDGQVNVTRDGGAHWMNVTKNIPDLPPWGTVWSIAPSRFDAASAYVVVNLQHQADYDARVYKTTNYGASWKLISGSVPKGVNSSAHIIVEDPVRKGMLYLGTDNSVYVSWDDGGHWTALRNNMPPAPVYWLTIQKQFNDLLVGTYGRGIWILDDVTPLRDYAAAAKSDAYLFKPRAAYRFRTFDNTRQSDAGSHVLGENPEYGADINFNLKEAVKKAEISIAGADGKTIRTIKLEKGAKAGLNRVWWDLKYDPSTEVKLRTSPPGQPWVAVGKQGWRPFVAWSHFDGAPRAVPGKYTVKLSVDGKDFSAPLEVLPDPHTLGTPKDVEAEVQFLLEIRGEMNDVAGMINHLEWTRKQVEDLEKMLGDEPKNAAALKAARDFEQKAIAVENSLVDVSLTGRGEDSFRAPMRLYGRLMNLGSLLDGAPGQGSSGADLPPTTQEIEVNKLYQGEIAQARKSFEEFTTKDVAALNEALRASHLGTTIAP